MENNKNKVLLIVNPCAGRTKSRAGTFDIVNKFSTNDYDFSIHTTKCQGDATNIVKKHYDGKDLVVCCGGDGTLNETINGVMEMPNRVPVGYIPSGSTNDLANTLGIPTDIKKATDLIMSGQTNTYDIGLFNNRYFSYVASFGAFTSASYSTSQKLKNVLGHSAYILQGVKDWSSIKSQRVKIEYDDGVIEDDVMLCAVANSTSISGLFRFNEDDVKLNDGFFEVLIIKKINPLQVPIFLRKLIKQDYDGKQILFFRTRHIKFTSQEPIAWTLDGEYGGSHKVSNIHVLSKAIEICSPENNLFEKDEEIENTKIDENGKKVKKSWRERRAEKVAASEAEQNTNTEEKENSAEETVSQKLKRFMKSPKQAAKDSNNTDEETDSQVEDSEIPEKEEITK